ncbi:MAG: response regulator [Bacteroidales bacterium]|jgi:two-component system LytT family response regulator|nr:response regulator [Bacteroidales bacterium]MDD4385750.1 response regulator [Bacteroidales bacterium]MDY0196411.1 response regulator [Tenuifilaceae bacterium]
MLKAIIIDDELAAHRSLEILLKLNCPNVSIVGKGFSVSEGIKLIKETNPDIVFLDIEMPQGNGFELLEQLPDYKFEVIFITAYNQYAIKAFKYSAIDYILKPIDINELILAVEKVTEQLKNHIDPRERYTILFENIKEIIPRKLVIPDKGKYNYVDLSLAIIARLEKGTISFTMSDGSVNHYNNTNTEMSQLLAQKGFLFVDKGIMVNLSKVLKFQKTGKGSIVLEGNHAIEIGTITKEEFIEHLTKYNKNQNN